MAKKKVSSSLKTPGNQLGGSSNKKVTNLGNVKSTGSALSPTTGPTPKTTKAPKSKGKQSY